jgi:hypothetical protein
MSKGQPEIARARRLALLRELYAVSATMQELAERHPRAASDLQHLRRLGLVEAHARPYPLVQIWKFKGRP